MLPNGNSTGFVSYYSTTRNYKIGNTSIFINYGQPQFYNSFQEIFFKIDSDNLENIIGLFTIKIKSEKIVDGGTECVRLYEFDTPMWDSPHRYGGACDLYFRYIIPLLWCQCRGCQLCDHHQQPACSDD